MKPNLTVHEKINFRSHFKPEASDTWYMRLMRPYYHYDLIRDFDYAYKTDIQFFPGLVDQFKSLSKKLVFRLKF